MRPHFHSIHTRLTLWYAAVLALTLWVFSVGVYFFVKKNLLQEIETQLNSQLFAIAAALPEGMGELAELTKRGSVELFQVMKEGHITYQTESWRQAGLGEAVKAEHPSSSWLWTSPDNRPYHLRASALTLSGQHFLIIVAENDQALQQSLHGLATTLLIGSPCALLLAVLGGFFLAGRTLSPLGTMASKAEQITAERLSERLPVENSDDELGRLATVFNATLARLQDSFETLRRFTADASHELRTPLTAIRSVGENGLQSDLDPAAYREVIGSMLEEADRLARLVEGLLSLARAESEYAQMPQERIDLGWLARNVVDYLGVLAEEKGQLVHLGAQDGVVVSANRGMLRQALVNVLDNAIKYTPPQGQIQILVNYDPPGEAVIEVVDEGPGIPLEYWDKIFDRFYRIEKGHADGTGGAGLGLAITRRVVEAHGGRVELESQEGRGSCFRIVLPATEG